MGFQLDPDYKDVPTRIADFKAKHPEGSLRPANPKDPYRIEAIDGRFFVVYVAAAYRSPDDKKPGIGVAWEPFPGRTPYTTNSELQNAETSAWGRAIVAALASESKAVASAEDVRNRRADAETKPPEGHVWVSDAKSKVLDVVEGDKDAAANAWRNAGLPPSGMEHVTVEQEAKAMAEAELVMQALAAAAEADESEAEQPELPEVSNRNGMKAAHEAHEKLYPKAKKEAAE